MLATGGCDNSIRLWRKEHNNLYLIWSTHVTLCSIDANIEGAEISDNNAALLVVTARFRKHLGLQTAI